MPLNIRKETTPSPILFSWGHSNYLTTTVASKTYMNITNTGTMRVIVTTVPSSNLLQVGELVLYNMMIELIKHVPFDILLKLFQGIAVRKDAPLCIITNGVVTQAFSKELYGGILIKLPTEKWGGILGTNVLSIYAYDVNTDIPDMGIGYANKAQIDLEPTLGLYQITPGSAYRNSRSYFHKNLRGLSFATVKSFLDDRAVRYKLGPEKRTIEPGIVTTLGAILASLNTAPTPTPRVLIISSCGNIDDTTAELITQRLAETHPKAVLLNDISELITFFYRLVFATRALARQASPVMSYEMIREEFMNLSLSKAAPAAEVASPKKSKAASAASPVSTASKKSKAASAASPVSAASKKSKAASAASPVSIKTVSASRSHGGRHTRRALGQ